MDHASTRSRSRHMLKVDIFALSPSTERGIFASLPPPPLFFRVFPSSSSTLVISLSRKMHYTIHTTTIYTHSPQSTPQVPTALCKWDRSANTKTLEHHSGTSARSCLLPWETLTTSLLRKRNVSTRWNPINILSLSPLFFALVQKIHTHTHSSHFLIYILIPRLCCPQALIL